ncbi:MAG: tetratricopeptide repeat protein [Planctomycetota bacterium]
MKRCRHIILVPIMGLVLVRQQFASESPSKHEAAYIDGLRQRQLNRLLEVQCERMLLNHSLAQEERAKLTFEFSGLLSDRGSRTLDVEKREALWNRADQSVELFLDEVSGAGKPSLHRYRWAGLLLERSQQMQDLALVSPQDPVPMTQALQWATTARNLIEQAIADVRSELDGRRPMSKLGPEDLKPSQLQGLLRAAEFRRAETSLAIARAELDPVRKKEALVRTETQLAPFTKDPGIGPVYWEAVLDLAEVFQLTGRRSEAISVLERPASGELPKGFLPRKNLTLARLYLEDGDPEKSLQLLSVPKEERLEGALWGYFTFEAMVRLAAKKQAFAPEDADKLRRQSLEILDDVSNTYGSYWNRRGETVIGELIKLDQAGDNLLLLARLANILRGKKQFDEAVQMYERAYALAMEQKDFDLAARLQFDAAATLYKAKEYGKAADGFTRMAEQNPRHALAPRALINAAYSLGLRHQQEGGGQLPAKYQEVLERHLKMFADDIGTAPEAHLLLAKTFERQKQWEQALQHYEEVPREDQRYPGSLEAIVRIVHDRLMEKIEEGDPDVLEQVRRTVVMLERVVRQPPEALRTSEQGKRSYSLARYVLARLLLLPPLGRTNDAATLLGEVVEDQNLDAALRGRGWRMLLEMAVENGDSTRAASLAREGFKGQENSLMATIQQWSLADTQGNESQRAAILAVTKVACDRLLDESGGMKEEQRRRLRLLRGQVYEAEGNHQEAVRLLGQLRAEAPRDRDIAMAYARALSKAGQYAESEKQWEQLCRGLTRGVRIGSSRPTISWKRSLSRGSPSRPARPTNLPSLSIQNLGARS